METRVDLPAPFSPSNASTSPCASSREMASLASRAPKRLVMPCSRRTGDVMPAPPPQPSPGGGGSELPLPCRRLRLRVVHLHRELAVQDGLFLVLHLGDDLGG